MKRFAWLTAAALLLAGCATPAVPTPDERAVALAMQEHADRMIVLAVANPMPPLPLHAGSTISGYGIVSRYSAGSNALSTVAELRRKHGLREVAAWPITALQAHCAVLELPSTASRDTVLAALAADEHVLIAQPLQTFETQAASGYNDPYLDLQRGFTQIGAAAAHRMSRGNGVHIAIIDTGADTRHPDLQGRVAATRNFVDTDAGRFDGDRHGTAVAGIIAAVANNRIGIVGVAPEAKVSVFKACWESGGTEDGARCNSFTLAQGLAAAIDGGADIINLSLAGPPDRLLAGLVTEAIARGQLVIGAVPRSGSLAGFPAGVPGVIAVDVAGSLQQPGVVYAPGRDILTLVPDKHYDFSSGSSIAAAHVSAAAALLRAAEPQLDGDAVRSLLTGSISLAATASPINVCAAMSTLTGGRGCDQAPLLSQANGGSAATTPAP